MRIVSIAAAAALWTSVADAAPVNVYFNDLDGGEAFGTGISGALLIPLETELAAVQGFNGLGSVGNQFSGDFARNISASQPGSSLTLQLNGLPVHDSIDLDFLFAAIDSWDSIDGSVSPDHFVVLVDGVLVVQATFANASGTVTTAFGTDIGAGLAHRGFNQSFADRAFDVSNYAPLSTVAHSGSSLIVEFRSNGGGWQGGTDESWAIDNLSVTVNTVAAAPEPTAATLALGALAGFLSLRRRA